MLDGSVTIRSSIPRSAMARRVLAMRASYSARSKRGSITPGPPAGALLRRLLQVGDDVLAVLLLVDDVAGLALVEHLGALLRVPLRQGCAAGQHGQAGRDPDPEAPCRHR